MINGFGVYGFKKYTRKGYKMTSKKRVLAKKRLRKDA